MGEIDEAITETVEEAVEEALEEVVEEVSEAAEEVEEAAEEVEEAPAPEPVTPVGETNEALELSERIRTIAKEEAYEAVERHEHFYPHGSTVFATPEPAPEPEPEPESPLDALLEGSLDVEEEPEDNEPAKDHSWYKRRGGK